MPRRDASSARPKQAGHSCAENAGMLVPGWGPSVRPSGTSSPSRAAWRQQRTRCCFCRRRLSPSSRPGSRHYAFATNTKPHTVGSRWCSVSWPSAASSRSSSGWLADASRHPGCRSGDETCILHPFTSRPVPRCARRRRQRRAKRAGVKLATMVARLVRTGVDAREALVALRPSPRRRAPRQPMTEASNGSHPESWAAIKAANRRALAGQGLPRRPIVPRGTRGTRRGTNGTRIMSRGLNHVPRDTTPDTVDVALVAEQCERDAELFRGVGRAACPAACSTTPRDTVPLDSVDVALSLLGLVALLRIPAMHVPPTSSTPNTPRSLSRMRTCHCHRRQAW